MKKAKFILISIALFFVTAYAGAKFMFHLAGTHAADYIGEFKPEISNLEDGSYEGRFGYMNNRFEGRVKFIIENHQLAGCNFDKLFGTPGYNAPYNVSAEIDRTKKLDFDALSGATITSNYAKAAIKNAIENGPAGK